jgi:folate-binding protein YgfZ
MTEAAQLDALLHGAAFAQITDRAFLRVTGADATRWLNGMVTNNVAALAPGEGNYNFLLNAQGRIQGDCTIYREPGDGPATFLLETQNSQLETIHKTLDHFIIMDDVELARLSMFGLLIIGTKAHQRCLEVSLPYPGFSGEEPPTEPFHGKMYYGEVDFGRRIALCPPSLDPKQTIEQVELWNSDIEDIRRVERQLVDHAGTSPVSPETLEAFRIYSGTPKFGVDIRDRDLPQETGQTHALHFSKGCYLGQEIVERIRSRGQVHRQFTQFTLTGEMPQTFPAPIEANGKAAGELTSAAQIGDTIYALGYARREALDTHQPLTYLGGTATPLATGKLETGN